MLSTSVTSSRQVSDFHGPCLNHAAILIINLVVPPHKMPSSGKIKPHCLFKRLIDLSAPRESKTYCKGLIVRCSLLIVILMVHCRNYLRRDICRGVTEYDEYPALSNLIEAFENEERARLYPSRPRYEDDYSYFVDFAEAGPPTITNQPSAQGWSQTSSSPGAGYPSAYDEADSLGMEPEDDEQTRELNLIAHRKAQLEQKQQEMKDRIRKLEQEKHERERAEREKTLLKERQEQEAKEVEENLAKQKADKEAALKREQEELAQRVREAERQRMLKLKQEKEEEERQKQAEEEARIQRKREEAERLLRAQAAEEERRRQEALRIAEARRREEEERRRLQQIAEEKARLKREAERQAQLARELAEKKRLQRIRKQALAVMKFRFFLWKKYAHSSRYPSGPIKVSLDTSLSSSYVRATDKINWLFERKNRMASLISKNHRRAISHVSRAPSSPKAVVVPPIDMIAAIAPSLRHRQPSASLISWKVVIADLQSNLVPSETMSFGQWCAGRAGISFAEEGSGDAYRVYKAVSNSQKALGVLPCCRYVDVGVLRSEQGKREALSSVSAVLVPVELTWIQDPQRYQQWESLLGHTISSLPATSSIALVVLASAAEGIRKSVVAPLLETIEQSARRVQSANSPRVSAVCFHLMVDEDGGDLTSMSRRFEQVVTDAAVHSTLHPQLVEIGLKDLVDSVMHLLQVSEASESEVANAEQLQTHICTTINEIHGEIFSSEVIGRDFPPPELRHVLPEPPADWNSSSKQTQISSALHALTSSRIDFSLVKSAQTFKPDHVCDYFFNLVSVFIDKLFEPVATEVSVFELKKRIFAELVLIHEQLTSESHQDLLSSDESSRTIPWRTIFEMTYSAYSEALGDLSVYAPVDSALHRRLVSKKDRKNKPTQVAPPSLKRVDAPHPVVVSVKHLKDALGGRVPTIALSSLSIGEQKRESRIEHTIAPRATTRALQRLRVDLEREKAASTQFRHMLRAEMQRWSVDTAP